MDNDVRDEPSSDETLARRLADGDAAALEALHHRYAGLATRIAAQRVGDAGTVEDIVQTAFLRLWEQRQTLHDPKGVAAWLRRTTERLAVDHLRRRQDASLDEAAEAPAEAGRPDEVAQLREAAALYQAAVASLEARHRHVIELAVSQDLHNGEVAVALGTSPRRATILVHKARMALNRALRTAQVVRASPCDRLPGFLPAEGQPIGIEDRTRIEHHIRRCDVCRAAAGKLPPLGDDVLGVLPVLAAVGLLSGFHHPAAAAEAGAATAAAGHAHASGHWFAVGVGAAAVAVAALAAATALALSHESHGAPAGRAGPAVVVGSAPTGRVIVTGGDEDVHSQAGANRQGARAWLEAAIHFVRRGAGASRILLVTDLTDPHDGIRVDPRLGLQAAGIAFDVATAGPLGGGAVDLRMVAFSSYDVIIVASDYGGWLRQAEIDVLVARRPALAAFVRGGGGLIVLAEGGGADPKAARLTTGDWYAFVGRLSSYPMTQPGNAAVVTAAGAAAGFVAADESDNYVHAVFDPAGGAIPLETLGPKALTLDATSLLLGTG